MKTIIVLLLATLLLVACNEKIVEPVKENIEPTEETVKEDGPTQEEINKKLKEEAVRADFVELNVDNPPDGKRVFIEGKVSVLMDDVIDKFMLTSVEGDGYGMYRIELMNTTKEEYTNGDQVRVYGVVNGKDESGMPKVTATILEHN